MLLFSLSLKSCVSFALEHTSLRARCVLGSQEPHGARGDWIAQCGHRTQKRTIKQLAWSGTSVPLAWP